MFGSMWLPYHFYMEAVEAHRLWLEPPRKYRQRDGMPSNLLMNLIGKMR